MQPIKSLQCILRRHFNIEVLPGSAINVAIATGNSHKQRQLTHYFHHNLTFLILSASLPVKEDDLLCNPWTIKMNRKCSLMGGWQDGRAGGVQLRCQIRGKCVKPQLCTLAWQLACRIVTQPEAGRE